MGQDQGRTIDIGGLASAIACIAAAHAEPCDAMRRALDQIGEATGWQLGHLYLATATDVLESTSAWWHTCDIKVNGLREASDRLPLTSGAGLPGRVLASGEPAWVADVLSDDNFPRARDVAAAGLRSAFAFPITAGGQTEAIFEFFHDDTDATSRELETIVAAIGAQLGRVFERERADRQLKQAVRRSWKILDGAGDSFVAMDATGAITGWNAEAEKLFGYSRSEALGRQVSELIIPEELRAAHDEGVRHFLETERPRVMGQRLELEALRRSGERFPMEMSFWAMQIDGEWAFYSFGRDITERKAREADLAYRALHDELTGLANRTLIIDRIEQALARRARNKREVAVLFCDLDRFKMVNDSIGHSAGDQLLQAVATRLRAAVRPADTVGRVSGDEFVVVCEDLPRPAEARRIAQRIIDTLVEPLELNGDRLRVHASIGIAIAEATSGDAEALLRDADAAMYRAKECGTGRIETFNERMRAHLTNRLRNEVDLTASLERGELRLHYQPIVGLEDHRVVGVEALVRWQHPQRGLLAPGEFIPLAEETGMIVPIGSWVLTEACRQAKAWQRLGCDGLKVGVNLSARQISQAGFVNTVIAILERADLDPRRTRMNLEVTESLLMSDPAATAATLGQLRDCGIRLSIDDFGTGYSSLAYLKHFPVDVVKIDRSFINGIEHSARELALLAAISELGHALELVVLAEGVETAEQRDLVARAGCELAQGYYFAKPASPEEITQVLLADGHHWAAAGPAGPAANI